jgi:hypothetical protein
MAIKATSFSLVSAELMNAVVLYGKHLEAEGFRVTAEPEDLEYPSRPVFLAVRSKERHFFEVSSKLDHDRAIEWSNYGKTSKNLTTFTAVVVGKVNLSSTGVTKIANAGIGLDLIEGEQITHIRVARDLSIGVEFPTLNTSKLRRQLQSAKKLFEEGNWKESYEDACGELEKLAREYLVKGIANGRLAFVTPSGKHKSFTEEEVLRMPLGPLGETYGFISLPTHAEAQVAVAIKRLNPNRKTVAHYKKSGGKRGQRLREDFGKELYVIVNALDLLNKG